MSDNAIIAIASAAVMSISTIGPSISQGKAAVAAMEAIARQPDAAGNVRSTLIVAMALLEALSIYGLLIAFMLVSKIA